MKSALARVALLGAVAVTAPAVGKPINGFAVAIGHYATSDTYPTPTSTAGPVLLNVVGTVNGDPYDPFVLSPGLKGVSPYIAIEAGGSVTFSFPTPMRKLQILWGSVDSTNIITFYDAAGKQVGALTGQGIQQAYNINAGARQKYGYEASVRIISPTKFSKIVLTTGISCFEFSNVFAE
ncbi:MAG: hypothetical protein WDN04_15615 [Rhodospirillales bacterium]